MTAGEAFAVFVAVAAAVVAAVFFAAAVRVRRRTGEPDPAAAELLPGLTEELRKWQAEAAHWRTTAERLQRELDRRDD